MLDGNLDRNQSLPNLTDLLVNSLSLKQLISVEEASKSPSKIVQNCWCASASSVSLHILPCNHTAHEQCLRNDIDAILSCEQINGNALSSYRCMHHGCQQKIFIGLNRRKGRANSKDKGDKVDKKHFARGGNK